MLEFTNFFLSKRFVTVTSLGADFKDGTRLKELIEILSGSSVNVVPSEVPDEVVFPFVFFFVSIVLVVLFSSFL